MCLLYFVPPRLISSNIHQYTMIIFSFILLYLVLPRAISSKSVHPFLEARFGGTSNQLAGGESPSSYCELYRGHRTGPEKRKTSRNEKTRHAMTTNDMQDISSKMLQDISSKMSEGWFDLFDPRLCHRQSAQLRGINRSSKNFWPKNRC